MAKKRRKRRNPYHLVIVLLILLIIVVLTILVTAHKGFQKLKDQQKDGDNTKQTAEHLVIDGSEIKEQELTDEEKIEMEIDEILKDMTLEDKVSQLFFVIPESLTGVDVATRAGDMTREALEKYPVGGVVLFSQNIQSEEQLKTMLANLHQYSKYPLFTGVDEEGGSLVARVANSGVIEVPTFPDMQEIGNAGNPEKAYEVGTTLGSYLKELGFNVDFAPVADVFTNPSNTVIGARAFGSDPQLVSEMVAREVEGMQEQGVSAAIKHFPGHGDTYEDSHAEMATSYKTIEELRATEFLPFQAGIEAGTDFVMVGHIAVPEVTGDNTPASLSQMMVTEYLRGELGYDGIVITDSMRMGAVVNYYDAAQAAVLVLQAGGDMILMPEDFVASRQAVLDAVANHELTEERINESLRRIYRIKLAGEQHE